MQARTLLSIFAALAISTFSVALGAQAVDGVRVTLPDPVTVGDVVLQPGEYEIRRASSTDGEVLSIFDKDRMVYKTVVLTIPTLGNKTAEETKVLLHHIGNNYYFDKIWMAGKTYGYEFVLPERARALQRELAASAASSTKPVEQAQSKTTAPEPDRVAAVLPEPAPQAEPRSSQVTPSPAAPSTPTRPESPAVAPEPAPQVNQSESQTPATPQVNHSDSQTPGTPEAGQTPERLPETASNWFAYVTTGILLLLLSTAVRTAIRA